MSTWLTYRELADRLGVSQGAAKIAAARRGWERQSPNKPGGPVRVLVPDEVRQGYTGHTPYTPIQNAPDVSGDVSGGVSPDTHFVPGDTGQQHPTQGHTIPLSVFEKVCADHAAEIARAQSLHLDLIARIQAQASAERAIFMERVDAAEIRAESAEARAAAVDQKLHQVLDRLLERQVGPAPDGRSWWSRWFGVSKRSEIG